MKRIILAQPRGFCAGVERAIRIVEGALKLYGAPIYVILAFVDKESGFNRWAKPKRTKLFTQKVNKINEINHFFVEGGTTK